jgi:hypothetical protein
MADSKYHQVAVPEHPGGSSFVRMGSFPSGGDPAPPPAGFEKSRSMAAVTSASRVATSGQWSHSDGNRVTTTVGNVVDVIHGTYLAYRSAAASPPGPTLTATWADSVYTQVGTPDTPIGDGSSSSDPTGSDPTATVVPYSKATNDADANGADTKLPKSDVVTATWAGRVLTYVGSAAKPVPYVFTQTYGGKVATYNTTTVGNVTLNTATGGDVDTTTKITGGGSSNTTTDVTGGDVNTTTNVTGGNSLTKTQADAITATNTAAAITNVNTAANILNQNFGIQENLNEGAMFNVNIGFTTNVTIGGQFNVSFPETWDLTPESTEIKGIKTDIAGVRADVNLDKTAIAATEQKLAAETTRITAAATDIGAVKTSIDDVNTKISAETTKLAALRTDMGDVRTDIYALQMMGI